LIFHDEHDFFAKKVNPVHGESLGLEFGEVTMTTVLEKVQSLHNYLLVNSASVDILLAQGIDKLISRERQRLLKLQVSLSEEVVQFEQRYHIDSIEFQSRYQQGELGDALDFMEWSATLEMLQQVKQHIALLSGQVSEQNH
jgi:hypothetical protein